MKKTDDFESFIDAAACMVNTYGGNMESEEEVNAVLDRLYRILLHRENARLYLKTYTIDAELTPEGHSISMTRFLRGSKNVIRYENDCNCCEVCCGCGLRRVPHIYCDCGCEVANEEKLYRLAGTEQWL